MDALSGLSWTYLVPFLLTCLIIESTPGPNMAYLTIISASRGRRFGYMTVAGVTLGLLIIGLAAAAGLATLISGSDLLYQSLRIAGVLYLLWLAYDEWRDADDLPEVEIGEGVWVYFRRGLIVNVLNPKAAVFYVTILPTFMQPETDILPQAMFLTIIYVGIATTMHVLIVSLAGLLKPVIGNPARKRIARRALAILLALVALWFAIGTKA